MSLYEQNILDFYKTYEEHPELFTKDNRDSLKRVRDTFSEGDSIEKISDTISLWCEDHPNILNVLLGCLPSGAGKRGPGSRPTRLTPKEALKLLENIIRQSNPDSGSPSSQPQTLPKE
jgi:hypothetical protein